MPTVLMNMNGGISGRLREIVESRLASFRYPQRAFAGHLCMEICGTRGLGSEDRRVLDAACGYGEVAFFLARKCNLSVVGCDISQEKIASAKRWFRHPRLSFVGEDVFSLLATSASFDVICLVNALFLFEDVDRLAAILHQGLKPGGVLVVVVPNRDSSNYREFERTNQGVNKSVLSIDETIDCFRRAGFGSERVQSIVRARLYGRSFVPLPPVLSDLYLCLQNRVQERFRVGELAYSLLSFRREQLASQVA